MTVTNRGRFLPRFPTTVTPSGPITSTQTGLTLTLGADFRTLGALGSGYDTSLIAVTQDPTTGAFSKISLANLFANTQPLDATLTALAGLDTASGLVEQTGADTFTKRLIGVANATDIPTRADVDARFQPLDADLTALAALSGTNNIYYRSAASTWSSVTIGSGLTFTGGQLAASATAPLGYRLRAITTFTSSGTWTPAAYTRLAIIKCQAGGGGGGGASGSGTGAGAGAGGGGGGYSLRALTAGWGATETITVGAAGTAGTSSGGTGGTGGSSSVGTLVTATGGSGGTGSASCTTSDIRGSQPPGAGGGTGGTGGTSIFNFAVSGGAGSIGAVFGSSTTAFSGQGGASHLGLGGQGRPEGTDGVAGAGYGAGGSGGAASTGTGRAGGAGTVGIVIIEEYE